MTGAQWLLLILVIAVIVVAAMAIYSARKLDSLNTAVTKSRKLLENALLARSHSAYDVATGDVLDIAGAVVLADAAQEASEAAIYPIVDDGLDSLNLSAQDGSEYGDLGAKRDGARPDRLSIESELSRALRLTVDELDEGADSPLLDRLEQNRQTVRLARRFHNNHVAQARRVRRSPIVRILRLHGSAPEPRTVDLDDE